MFPLLNKWAPIPFGFCRRHATLSPVGVDYILTLPLLPWFGRKYLINYDDFATGWWLARFMLLVRVDRAVPGFELHVRWGSTPLRVTHENHGWPL